MPSWLLFNGLKNKACHNYSLIVAQFRDRYIQGRYIQVRLYRGPYFILARLGTSLQQNDAGAVALRLSR